MTKLLADQIRKGIKESDTKGFTWKATPTGMSWSYGVEFTFEVPELNILTVTSKKGLRVATVMFGASEWDDCRTLEEAYLLATKQAIRTANYLY